MPPQRDAKKTLICAFAVLAAATVAQSAAAKCQKLSDQELRDQERAIYTPELAEKNLRDLAEHGAMWITFSEDRAPWITNDPQSMAFIKLGGEIDTLKARLKAEGETKITGKTPEEAREIMAADPQISADRARLAQDNARLDEMIKAAIPKDTEDMIEGAVTFNKSECATQAQIEKAVKASQSREEADRLLTE